MCDCKWPFAMTRGRVIQREKTGLIRVGSAFPVTHCRDLGCRKEGTLPIKRGLTDRGNLLFGTLVTIQGIDGGAAFRLGCRVMSTKKRFEKLLRCRVYARCPVAAVRRLVELLPIPSTL